MARTENERAQATSIFATYKAEVDKRELSNTDNYDKNILTLSSAGLAISLTVFKDIALYDQTAHIWLLYSAWILFGCAILATIFSFLISNAALRAELEIAYKYYIEEDESIYGKVSLESKALEWVNRFSGGFFVLAIISVITFGVINFDRRTEVNKSDMVQKTQQINNDGLPPPVMQRVPIDKGATVPFMQPVTQTNQPDMPAISSQPSASSSGSSKE
ncbi:hypothetical protein AVA06_001026 [Salmonella enterica subsp. enterica]|nr:hypothetical protein [Salmonella enterica subsp. enterica]EDW9585763.1 hypothetical protein [Salmonella enterica subsp. enterica]EED9672586.1 hypothetical protein [Salmonella enterica subsp. enterica]